MKPAILHRAIAATYPVFGGALLLALLLLATATPSSAFHYPHRTFTELDGLPNSEVSNIAQDGDRLIWFAARGAVASYDGGEWRHYTYPADLPVNKVAHLATDSKGVVWGLGTQLTLIYHNEGIWQHFAPDSARPKFDDDYIDYYVTGFEMASIDDQPTPVITTDRLGVVLYVREEWVHLTRKDGLGSDRVFGVTQYGDSLLFATERGISVWYEGVVTTQPKETIEVPSPTVLGIARDTCGTPDGKIWAFGYDWVGEFRDGRLVLEQAITPLPRQKSSNIPSPLPDGGGGLFFDYHFVAHQYLPGGFVNPLTQETGLAAQGFTDAIQDYEGGYWFTTMRGVTRIPSLRFVNYSETDGLLEQEVSAVVEDNNSAFYFGHNQGITIYSEGLTRTIHFNEQKHDPLYSRVMGFQVDRQGRVWAAVSRSGIARVQPDGRTRFYPFHGDEINTANSLTLDRDGTLLVSTERGLYRFNGQQLTPVPGFPLISLRNVTVSSEGRIFCSSFRQGLTEWTGDSLRYYQSNTNADWNETYCAHQDEESRILVGTAMGLVMVQGDSLAPCPEEALRITRPVYFITPDPDGNLWFGANNGVYRWDGRRMVQYTRFSGLAGMETNRGAGYVDSHGKLWIGTNTGVSRYNRRYDILPRELPPPRVEILWAESNGRMLDPKHPFIVPPQFDLSLKFRCVSFLTEGEPTYQIQLHKRGAPDIESINPHSQYVHYTNLEGGKYWVTVRAQDALGRWSEPVETAVFRVQHPWYQRTWFIFVALAVFVALIILMNNYLTTRRYSAHLQKEVLAKTRELREVMTKYRNLVERAVLGILRTDPQGRILEGNMALVEMLGQAEQEHLTELSLPHDLFVSSDEWRKLLEAFQDQDVFEGVETEWRRNNGEEIIVRLGGRFLRNTAAEIEEVEIIVEDVTEQRQLTDKMMHAQRLESVGMLAGGIAHDFNNMLGAIMGNAEMARQAATPGSSLDGALQAIIQVTEKAAELTRQMLAYSGQGRYVVEPVDLSRHLREMHQLFQVSIPKHVEVHTDLAPDLPPVMADRAQLQQVALNLITNASEAIGEEPGEISIQTYTSHLAKADLLRMTDATEAEPGEFNCIEVSDSGCGMDKETLANIFEPFFTTKFTGRGLGLSAMMGIIHAHHGAIQVTSEPGAGTRFRIYLPTLPEEERQSVEQGRSNGGVLARSIPEPAVNNRSILIVDDDEAVRSVAVMMLEREGYTVTTAENGKDAIRLFTTDPQRFDLVLLDNHMPLGDAPEVLETIRKERPTLPVIVISGDGAVNMEERFGNLGVQGLLLKPFRMAELKKMVLRSLAN